jgi:glycine hydroxymethyltransferase
MLVDVSLLGLTGKAAEKILEAANITVNKNGIPFDPNPPMITSGIRIGTPALTTRGMGEEEMSRIGKLIAKVLRESESETVRAEVRREVAQLTEAFPLYPERLARCQASVPVS